MSEAEKARRARLADMYGRRVLARRAGEQANPRADVHLSHLSDLYCSPRYATSVPASMRMGALQHVLAHYLSHVAANEGELPTEEAPFLRDASTSRKLFAPRPWPRHLLEARIRQPTAEPADQLPSRRRSSAATGRTSPAATLTPAIYGDVKGHDERPRACLLSEADALLRCVLEQYDETERVDRCLHEQQVLCTPIGKDLDATPSQTALAADRSLWRKRMRRVMLAGTHLHDEFEHISGAVDALAKKVLDLRPGQSMDDSYSLGAALDDVFEQDSPIVATFLKVGWQRPPEPGYPMGRLARPPSEARAWYLQRQREAAKKTRRGQRRAPIEVWRDGAFGVHWRDDD